MCGIVGFLSTADAGSLPRGDYLFQAISELTASVPESLRGPRALTESERAAILDKLAAAGAESYRWMGSAAFLAVAGDHARRRRLEQAVAKLADWTGKLEALAEHAPATGQRDAELLNGLITGGKDIAWQLERDLLCSLTAVRDLCGDLSDAGPEVLTHAWELNLMLSSLNRLEVRGRDSAGVAVYVRFPGRRALEAFLQGPQQSAGMHGRWMRELKQRQASPLLPHGALLRPATHAATLLAVFKVANEVGRMGDNVAFLRQSIAEHALFQAALRTPGVEIHCLAHTRWASNGVISEPNCHPVDGAVASDARRATGQGELVAVLNGDIDNYPDLVERFVLRQGLRIDEAITTDAKIIPIVVGHYYRETGDLAAAFRRAFDAFEGSMAIGVMAADRPGELIFGQKGSGQGLFFGMSERGVIVASEMYGVVELTPKYVKAEGERVEQGEVFRLVAKGAEIESSLVGGDGSEQTLTPDRVQTAQITTRDINRGEHPHFLLKEIRESVDSVRKTLRGKFDAAGEPRFFLGPDVLPATVLDGLRSGRIRRILPIGQGTAAVSAEGVAYLLRKALSERGDGAPEAVAFKATELSSNHLSPDMSDALVVAISQSGTTTDTNCTVDMATRRGASILGIVNRRDSDLVYKSDGVFFTSDGRDVEMSVASTKAYYAQNVAGQILALALASELRTLPPEILVEELHDLEALPEAMERTLALEPQIAELAGRYALARGHWAVVGAGPSKIAADEIRIKLSELCYKSIAIDFLEDKKHIDLSSEPMIIVCATGQQPETISDAVKEVAIFNAHNSLPIVITDEGEDRFDPYAAGCIKVPCYRGRLGYLLCAMVGHLFGYHAAGRIEGAAERLRRIRADVQGALRPSGGADPGGARAPDPAALSASITEQVVEMDTILTSGGLDGGLSVGRATRLARAFGVLLGRFPVDAFSRGHPSWHEGVMGYLSEAIAELSRPIDAIKHQAKTVTVGISRPEIAPTEGPLWRLFRSLELSPSDVAASHSRFLGALEPLVGSIEGSTLYRLSGLDPLGRPTDSATIEVAAKTGSAREIASRNDREQPLSGTKWGVVRRGDIYLGYGQTDRRRILILPVIGERRQGHLLLYHLSLLPDGSRAVRRRALEAHPDRLERLRIAVTERNVPWSLELIDRVANDVLFFAAPEDAAEAMCSTRTEEPR